MSASEKLRALAEQHRREDEYGTSTAERIMYPSAHALAETLPQLVAVVEAAEQHLDPEADRRVTEFVLNRALAALDEALS